MTRDDDTADLSRRTFLQTTGTLTAAGLLGAGAASTAAAAAGELDPTFFNWRAREASRVWDRGYRGRPDRTIALTDSGIEARHPDLGPWNGVRATVRDGELVIPKSEQERVELAGEGESFSGTIGPGTFADPTTKTHEFTTPTDAEGIDATMTWTPGDVDGNGEDLELYLDKQTADGWERVAASTTGSQPEAIDNYVKSGHTYRFVVETWLNVTADYEISAGYYALEGEFEAADPSVVFEGVGTDGDDPKTVGWFDEGTRYGLHKKPRDPNGHGSHCASIMGGTGRASAIDPETVTTEAPGEVLALGDTRQYEVQADAGTGVFGSAYGTAIELILEGPDGHELDSAELTSDSGITDNVVVEAPAEQTGTYTVIARATGGELVSSGDLESISVGAFVDPQSTNGDRTGSPVGLHTGVAPNQSLVGLQGLSGPTGQLADHAEAFADMFNMRAVNMSWGYVGGLPLGSVGGILDSIPAGIKDIAEAGILTCAAAGNAATPANGNGSPAIADECISVTATGPLDGLSAYSSGGLGALDEDELDQYMKPDVSAPGGYVDDLINAALTGDANAAESDQPPIRDYTGKAGTSMATPFTTGVAGLVSQAMEEDAPASIALPAPAETDLDDVYRLKQVLLATASETAFTAAPFHRAHPATYEFGGRDPYEGFGRVNADAAVDAVTRPLSGSSDEVLGLNLPEDSRAVAGYVQAGPGTVEASVSFDYYSGGNKGQTKSTPHIDLFVYDAEQPAQYGEPNIVARAQGLQGDASATVSLPRDSEERTFYVVAKLVDVPGAVNGDDVQAHCTLDVSVEDGFFVAGTRSDDGSVFTGGQTNQVTLTANPSEDSQVRDVIPTSWTVLTDYSDDVDRVEVSNGVQYVYFTETATADTETSYTYFAEAPDNVSASDAYQFGPQEVKPSEARGWVAVSGTGETNYVVAQST
ncbi:S8 family peptidase [Haloarchaeobius sp. HME9146]|uniref:S8 family peptidase n=1 Tax=Haloarchaeobius sp. HME9146 TaxID=2978732 RepID=UPI0021C0B7BC|nr:S8 family peptidase [Haloarchaeobius sp. HME9146]MCT9095478.1 S8 family peptidase [Haloarchaeobius sp. HME9146]